MNDIQIKQFYSTPIDITHQNYKIVGYHIPNLRCITDKINVYFKFSITF